MSKATFADGFWSIRRYIEANLRPISPIHYSPPQTTETGTYILFAPLRTGNLDLYLECMTRLSAVSRGGTVGMEAEDLASKIANVFTDKKNSASFDLYDKEANSRIGTCLVRRVDVEPLVHFPDGTDVVPVDVTFRFRSTYAPRV